MTEDATPELPRVALLCDLRGILDSVRANTGARAAELVRVLRLPALYLIAGEERSALGPGRARLLGSLPAEAEAIEFDSGHTIHRDRFDAYMAEVLRWLEPRRDDAR